MRTTAEALPMPCCRRDAVLFACLLLASLLLPVAAARAAEGPEIQRAAATAQADGATFTLRQIPEACVRLQGTFTGATPPVRLDVVPTRPGCQPRARFLGVADAAPPGAGWRLNDLIRVPSAHCPGLTAVLTVWRRPGRGGTLALDAQGRARIVLEDAMHGSVPATGTPEAYVAQWQVEGTPCGR